MENFDIIYDEMNEDYARLEVILSSAYSENPDSEMFYSLLEVANNLLNTQRHFIKSYGPIELKDGLLEKIDSKKEALDKAISKDKVM